MQIGAQLIAPEGFGSLLAGRTHYLLSNRADLPTTTLIWYVKVKCVWRVHLIRVAKPEFESALLRGALVLAPEQHTVPPWLEPVEGVAIDALEDGRRPGERTYRERAQEHLKAIQPLLTGEFERDFDAAKRPEKLLKKQLRAADKARAAEAAANAAAEGGVAPKLPQQNNLRRLLWYCTYRAFGEQLGSLLPAYLGVPSWPRAGRVEGKPLGRPPNAKGERHPAVDLAPVIQAAYKKYADLGVAMSTIHRTALTDVFGCKIETLANGNKRFYHPENKPFPLYQSFRHWVIRGFGLAEVQRTKEGEVRYRSRHAPYTGSFSQDSANYLDKVEGDVFALPERPCQLLAPGPGPSLRVCRLIDSTSGAIFGVGFSSSAERAEAYNLAKFSAVVSAALLIRMFDLPLEAHELPPRGLPARDIVDRGPGASAAAKGAGAAAPPARELAPAWSPQSKSTIEGSHPRSVEIQGAPSYVISDLNVFQLVRREFMRMAADNQTTDALKRLTPQMTADGVAANPHAIAKYLDTRGRTSARPMSDHEAVRLFLRPVRFVLRDDGFWLEKLRFSTAHLRQFGLPDRVPKGQVLEFTGYVHPYSLYVSWVEIGGRLHEIQPLLRIRDDPEQLHLTLEDLEQLTERNLELAAAQREHAAAARRDVEMRFEDKVGQPWDASKRMSGKLPKRGSNESLPHSRPPPKANRR